MLCFILLLLNHNQPILPMVLFKNTIQQTSSYRLYLDTFLIQMFWFRCYWLLSARYQGITLTDGDPVTRPQCIKASHNSWSWPTVASSTKEVNPRLAKCPLVFNGRLANRGLTSLVKEATGLQIILQEKSNPLHVIWKLADSTIKFPHLCVTNVPTWKDHCCIIPAPEFHVHAKNHASVI